MPISFRDATEADPSGILAIHNDVIRTSAAVYTGAAEVESGSAPAAKAGLGHNGGPPLEEADPGASWRLWCWRRAHKQAWSAPREIAMRRLARAEALGMSYREYTLEILERGRYL